MITYAYIDASNLFYGGRKSLGWSIDYEKLIKYLKINLNVSNVYYFGGVEIHKFVFDYLTNDTVSLLELEKYLIECIRNEKELLNYENKEYSLEGYLKQIRFYKKLEKFGYKLILKPVKIYKSEKGKIERKANCDAEMVYYLMKDKSIFDRVIVLSGDGDFLVVLKHLRNIDKKEVVILARGPRTANEIKKFAGAKFRDFLNLQDCIEIEDP